MLLRQGKPLDEGAAWGCLMTNLFVLPGLGSLMAGRRVGYAQAAVSLAGFGLTMLWTVSYLLAWLREGSLPEPPGPYFGWGVLGVLIFGGAWVWSLRTGATLLREARRGGP